MRNASRFSFERGIVNTAETLQADSSWVAGVRDGGEWAAKFADAAQKARLLELHDLAMATTGKFPILDQQWKFVEIASKTFDWLTALGEPNIDLKHDRCYCFGFLMAAVSNWRGKTPVPTPFD